MSFLAFLFWEPFGLVALWIVLVALLPFFYVLAVLTPWLRLGWRSFIHIAGKVAEWSDKYARKLGKKWGVYSEYE